MITDGNCSRCGAPLPASAPGHRCPRCLLQYAFDPEVAEADEFAEVSIQTRRPTPKRVHYFGDYELLEELARGGMGVIWKARQVSLNRIVAVKLLLAGKFSSAEFVKRFQTEAESAANLQHPNIVAIHEVGEHEGQHYFSMDFVDGQSLAERARDNPLPPEIAADYLKTIASAIHFAHQRGILHRDLKPSNILIDSLDLPRITDFGLAKRLNEDGEMTVTGQLLGTPNYMSPEQAEGRRGGVTVASDVYSLGSILYFLLTGRPPFKAETIQGVLDGLLHQEAVPPRLINSSIPRDLETICLKCLNKEPEERYVSAQALANDLSLFLKSEPILARPLSPVEKLGRWCRRKPQLAGLLFALILAVVLGFVGIAWEWRRAERNGQETVVKLRESLLNQARANRLGGRPGQRFTTLEVISNAVALQPGPLQRSQLRNQAIAAMALPDLVPVWTLENEGSWKSGSIDLPRSRYALVTVNGGVEIRRVPDNALLQELPARATPASLAMEFSPDGQFLAVSYHDGRVAIWNLTKNTTVLEEEGAPTTLEAAAFTPDSTRVAICGSTNAVGLWEISPARKVRTLQLKGLGEFLKFDSTGSRLAVSQPTQSLVSVFDGSSGALLKEIYHPCNVHGSAWHPIYPILAVGCADGSVRLWNPDSGEQVGMTMAKDGESGSAGFNHRGDLMINATWSRLNFWRPEVGLLLKSSNEPLTTLSPSFHAFGNGGQLNFGAQDDLLSRVQWGVPPGQLEIDAISSAPEVVNFQSDPCSFQWATFALDYHGSLAALSHSNTVHLIDVETGVELAQVALPGTHEPVFLPNGSGLIVSSAHGISAFSFITNENGSDLLISGPNVVQAEGDWTRLRLSPKGKYLAGWNADQMQIYSLPSLQKLYAITNEFNEADLLGPSFDTEEKLLAWGRWNCPYMFVWDIESRELAQKSKLSHPGGVTPGRPEFTMDGKWLVVCSMADLRLYESATWKLQGSIPWKSGANQIALLGGGQIAAVSSPGSGVGVHLLRLPDFKELAVLDVPADRPISHLGTSGDGLKLFAVRDDGTISVWNLPLIAAGLARLGLDWEAPLPGPGDLNKSPLRRPQWRGSTQTALIK